MGMPPPSHAPVISANTCEMNRSCRLASDCHLHRDDARLVPCMGLIKHLIGIVIEGRRD